MELQAADGLPDRKRRGAVLAIAASIALAVLDSSIANVALPSIGADLKIAPSTSILIVNAYQIAIIMSLLPLASLGEKLGYERVYCGGLLLFIISSFFCATAQSLEGLTLARVAQGLGAAGLMSVNTALVRIIYPQALLGRGMGINALVVASSTVLGPGIASGILSVAHWPWIFAINIPIGIAALLLALRYLPRTPRRSGSFDAISAVLSAATFGMLMTGVQQLTSGAASALPVLLLLGGLSSGFALWRRQAGRAAPLLPVDLLRIPIFALSIATSVGSFAAQMMTFVTLPFFLQHDLGRSQVETGLLMMPWPLALILVSPLAGRLSDRVPAGLLGGLGLLLMAIGLALLAFLPVDPSAFEIGWRMAMCGVGFGLFQTPNNRTLLSAAPRERSGGASGMLSTARLTGQTLGAALSALALRAGDGSQSHLGILTAAVIAAAAALISITRLRASPA
ncbi:MFS transporter [Pseudoroseomonas globiformis]|uniref:MFS transporter n=1 Tax=Teichococcus globiformis TaxID=2307229 RepID=A0ABV7G343_9PROT